MKQSRIIKGLLTIFVLGFILWFGGSVVRSAIAFDLFNTGAVLELKQNYSDTIKVHTVYLYGMLATYTGAGYGMAFISAILLLVTWRKSMKIKGWLFMAFVLFFIGSPVELFVLYYDIKLNIALYWNNVRDFANPDIQNYFVKRFTSIALTTSTGLAFLTSITSVLYIIWRPLDRSLPKEETEKEIVQ